MTEEILIDMPWRMAVPLLLEIVRDAETPQARMEAREELLRCARIADKAKRLQETLRRVRNGLSAYFPPGSHRVSTPVTMQRLVEIIDEVLPPTTTVEEASSSPEPSDG